MAFSNIVRLRAKSFVIVSACVLGSLQTLAQQVYAAPSASIDKTADSLDSGSKLRKSDKFDARVVMVYDHECVVWCGQVKPILSELQNQYKSRVQFVELDTSKDQLAGSKATAKSIGIGKFLNENADYAPVIGVFTSKGKLVKELVGPKKKEAYNDAIGMALSAQ